MLDRVLLDDKDFCVTAGMLGGMKVTVKHRNQTVSAPRPCVQHFQQTTESLKQRGVAIEPGSTVFAELVEEFAEAVFSKPGNPRWEILFGTNPDKVAERMMGYL